MDSIIKEMVKQAMKAKDAAYAPYSNHPVGAALMAVDGSIYSGANVENAAYPLSKCAEATAIGNLILGKDGRGGTSRIIQNVVVVGPGHEICTPCGGCRQSLREFAAPDAQVYMVDKDGKLLLKCDFSTLLPHSFGPDNLTEINNQ